MERLQRFPKKADLMTKQQFARSLIAALDRLGVEPGDDFVIDNIQPTLEEQHGGERRDTAAANS